MWLLIVSGIVLSGIDSRSADAWTIGSQLDPQGCHEKITTQALRNVRASLASLPRLAPTRNEAALIADVQFVPPADFVSDLAAMALLLGVRDNDLKGQNPVETIDLIQVHGDPDTQMEHCIRAQGDDDAAGNATGLAACIAFITLRATEALDGLDASGAVDPTKRMPLLVYVSIAGQVKPELPVFYVKMGQAMHALEDGFTHAYRTSDGSRVTVMLNWIDFVSASFDEPRDGPPHRTELDHCETHDPTIDRNFALATAAATELLAAAADPRLTRAQKIAQFEVITTKYLTFEPGCTAANNWCAPPEAAVPAPAGCSTGGPAGPLTAIVIFAAMLLARRRRTAAASVLVILAAVAAGPSVARADDSSPAAVTPAVPVVPVKEGDAKAAITGKEPGREEPTPTVAEVQAVREDKRLGSPLGFALSTGVSFYRGAGVLRAGGRYRISERFTLGLDAEWNPWLTTAPRDIKAGALNIAAVGVLRFPMRFDRVNLRSTLRLGSSTLLYDVYGAPKYSTGAFGSISLLGIDYDLGKSVRIVFDPAEISLAVPYIGDIPLVYEQFRFMIGLQFGA